MGVRFRKTINVIPGVKLNLSKSGISTSIGSPGSTVNFSKRGVRTTLGIPGTGISYTTSSGRKKNRMTNASMQRAYERAQTYDWKEQSDAAAWALSIFGMFGAHRYYTGKFWSGLLYSLTVGIFGFGWIIDVITILCGNFHDGNGFPLMRKEVRPQLALDPRPAWKFNLTRTIICVLVNAVLGMLALSSIRSFAEKVPTLIQIASVMFGVSFLSMEYLFGGTRA